MSVWLENNFLCFEQEIMSLKYALFPLAMGLSFQINIFHGVHHT